MTAVGLTTRGSTTWNTVTFDDTGSASPAVNLVGNLLPAAVAVYGAQSYTFGGSGKITGPAGLTHGSTGTTLLATNDYTGTTTISSWHSAGRQWHDRGWRHRHRAD